MSPGIGKRFGTRAVLVVAGLMLAAPVVQCASPRPAPTSNPAASYAIDNVSVSGGAHAADSVVNVAFDARWTGDSYPGRAQCRIDVFDSADRSVGSVAFEFGSYLPSTRTKMPVEIADGTATAATVGCGDAVLPPSDAGYVISDPQITLGGSRDEPRLTFRAHWTTETPPLLQPCVATIELVDGVTRDYAFELSVGDGEQGTALLPEVFRDGTVREVICN